jgi:hypothetical protein
LERLLKAGVVSFTAAGGGRYYLTPTGTPATGYKEFLKRKRLSPGQRPRRLSPTDRKAAVRANVLTRWFEPTGDGDFAADLLGFPMSIMRTPDGTYRAVLSGLANGHTEVREFGTPDAAAAYLLDAALQADGELDRRRDGERQAEEKSSSDAEADTGGDVVDPVILDRSEGFSMEQEGREAEFKGSEN